MKKLLVGILLGISLCFSLTSCGLLDDEFWEEIETELEEEESQNASNDETQEESADTSVDASGDNSEDASDNAEDEVEEASEDENYPVGTGPKISFETQDVYGNNIDDRILSGTKLVMLNLWEPWCGPCVNEMPDLSTLYDNYKDKGLFIIGAYTSTNMTSEAQNLAESYDLSYPLIRANSSISAIEQDYVPVTYLLDRNGNLITTEPFGLKSYSEWEEIIKQYLE